MKVEELMTKDPIVAEVPGHRDDALRLLVQHSVSGVPVVKSKTRKLAGVVTRSDIFRQPEEEQLALIMTSQPQMCSPKDEVSRAARIFWERRIHGLPVVAGDELVGVISPSDILRVIAEQNSKRTTDEFMVKGNVAPVFEETPLTVAWETMRVCHQNALPVLDQDARLVGIVADSDLFKKSTVDDVVKKGAQALAEDEDVWTWDGFRAIMPLYLATSKVKIPRVHVKEIMVREVQTVFQKTSVAEAARKMRRYKVNQLPVIDTNDRLVGMVTDLDLMAAMI
ncbi:MAG TPA: CBS domain-containing protein [Candidatus Thermoplasmatota archaeon]|jgi:CBS domain-containing protein|nr:CBS domain-containing protein [Candidatus Thermoplasmatota archaeon]